MTYTDPHDEFNLPLEIPRGRYILEYSIENPDQTLVVLRRTHPLTADELRHDLPEVPHGEYHYRGRVITSWADEPMERAEMMEIRLHVWLATPRAFKSTLKSYNGGSMSVPKQAVVIIPSTRAGTGVDAGTIVGEKENTAIGGEVSALAPLLGKGYEVKEIHTNQVDGSVFFVLEHPNQMSVSE